MSKDLDIGITPNVPDSPPRPSEAYLRGCNKPGSGPTKKLLVLDLNGTLVHRVLKPDSSSSAAHGHSQDSSASSSSSTSSSSSASTASTSTSTSSSSSTHPHKDIPPSTRTSHPRPYILTLLAYLFHPHTKSWLTTIAWSSSKPSSVVEMVQTCFGEEYVKELAAVWSREQEEEGVREEDRKGGKNGKEGKKKRKAVKDLGRIWGSTGSLPMPTSSLFPSTPSTHSSPSRSLEGHTQSSTILLDDTPSKAAHQPFNYVPVAKYTKEALLRDYAMYGKVVVEGKEDEEEGDGSPGGTEPSSPALVAPANLAEAEEGTTNTPTPILPPPTLALSASSHPPASGDEERPDPTLLAVIGILSALKEVSNVSYWIKRGGLTRTCPWPSSSYTLSTSATPTAAPSSPRTATTTAGNNAPWHTLPHVMEYWVQRGKEEAGRLGVEVRVYADVDEQVEVKDVEEDTPSRSPKRVDQLRHHHHHQQQQQQQRHQQQDRPPPLDRPASSTSSTVTVTPTPKPVGVVVLAA